MCTKEKKKEMRGTCEILKYQTEKSAASTYSTMSFVTYCALSDCESSPLKTIGTYY
jgi:hypothetical protein